MILTRPGRRQAVTLLRARVGEDSYGDPVEDWSDPERVPLRSATVQDRDSVETADGGRARVVTRRVLYADGDVGLRASDRVEVDGVPHLVDGEPAVHRGSARRVYTSAALVRATG